MAGGVQNVSVKTAELPKLLDTGSANGDKRVHHDKKTQVATDKALVTVVTRHTGRHGEAAEATHAVKLAAPKGSAMTHETQRAAVNGMERQLKQIGLSQAPVVTSMHGALAQQHVSTDDAKSLGVEGARQFSFSSDKGFDVMLEVSDVEQKDEQQDAEVQGKFVEMAHTAMMDAAQQDRNVGNAQMTAAISGGALQATTSLGGAFQQMKGLNTKSMSIKTELGPQAEIKMGAAGLSHELRGINKPVFSSENVSPVKIQRDTGETTNYEITSHGDGLSSDHAKVLNEDAPGFQHRDDQHGIRHEQNQIKASRYQLKGELINTGGTIGKNLIEGVSAQQQGNYHAEQKLAESGQQTAMAVANARNEAMHRDLDNTQKAIEAAKGQISNDNAVASQVAGNIRA
ncbi:IpaC/SipC family type III secretion system effector [Burkholderia pyrrocinia]